MTNEHHQASLLLISEPPLQVLPTLAVLVGLNEAIFIQQLHYWLQKPSAHEIEGKRWVYNTIAQWQEQLPFWSERTLQRIIADLAESGLILRKNFNKDRRDRTWWYTIDYNVLGAIFDEGYSKIRYGTMDSDKLAPSTSGQDDTLHSDKLAPSLMYTETTSEITSENTHKTRARAQGEFRSPEAEDVSGITARRKERHAERYRKSREQLNDFYDYGTRGKPKAEDEQPSDDGGEEREERQCPYCAEYYGGTHEDCTYFDPMDTLQPVATPAPGSVEACPYQPPFACEHVRLLVAEMAATWWPQRPPRVDALLGQFNDKERLHGLGHLYAAEDVIAAAHWWKAHKKPGELSPALFFSQLEMAVANAQSQEDGSARRLTPEEERARQVTRRLAETPSPPINREPPSAEDMAAVRDMVGDLTKKFNADAVVEAKRKRGDD